MTLADALDGMEKGDFSSEELTKAHIDACMDGADLNLSLIHISEPTRPY